MSGPSAEGPDGIPCLLSVADGMAGACDRPAVVTVSIGGHVSAPLCMRHALSVAEAMTTGPGATTAVTLRPLGLSG